jgi:hypothetical protein
MDPGSSHALSAYSWQGTSPHDFEIRFTEGATEHALGFFNAAGGDYAGDIGFDVPIEFWDLGIGTLDDPSDDRRITFMVIDDDVSNSFSWGDGLYIWDVDYDDAEWENPAWHTGLLDPDYAGLHYGRFWFYDFSGELERPDPGTVVRVLTNKMNGVADVFEFCARTICGDFNCDHAINITDAVYLINYIFIFGAEPACGAGDVDCSGSINISDAVYLISYIFADGPAPCAACPAANIVSTGSKLDH